MGGQYECVCVRTCVHGCVCMCVCACACVAKDQEHGQPQQHLQSVLAQGLHPFPKTVSKESHSARSAPEFINILETLKIRLNLNELRAF